jgi:hypothetical protein
VALSAATLAVLVVPLCAAVVALTRVRRDYYASTVRILGRMFITTAGGLGMIGAAVALSRGMQPFWPYLVITGLPALAVARIMRLYGDRPPGS